MKTGRLEAGDIMIRKVHTVRPSDPVRKVIDAICRHKVSGVPVVDGGGRLVGLISERDILYALQPGPRSPGDRSRGRRKAEEPSTLDGLLARDVMIVDVITATPATEALRLASVMALRKIRRIPIVEGKKLVGIVSRGDIYRAVFGAGGGGRR